MKKLYCMNCGAQIKGGIPNECSCGAEFDLADTKNIKKIITSIIFFVILMSPLLILIHFGRQYLQASIILYALLLAPGGISHSGPGGNRQLWPDENSQS